MPALTSLERELKDQVEELQEQVLQLQQQLVWQNTPERLNWFGLGLVRSEAFFLSALVQAPEGLNKAKFVKKYQTWKDSLGCVEPENKAVDVMLSRIRKKLIKQKGIYIVTVYGFGWVLREEDRLELLKDANRIPGKERTDVRTGQAKAERNPTPGDDQNPARAPGGLPVGHGGERARRVSAGGV